MSAYTCNLVTFGLSSLDLAFNSLAEVDGVLLGLDAGGVFTLDAEDDEGVAFPVQIETGWTDGTGSFPESVDASYMKRVVAVYVEGLRPDLLTLNVASGYFDGSVPLRLFHRGVPGVVPGSARAIPPRGVVGVWWRFGLSGLGASCRVSRVRGVFDMLRRRV